MRSGLLCCLVTAALAVSVPQRALGVVYDDFNALNRLIDINKWGGFETAGRGTEASRRIDAGKLRITARGAGVLVPASPTGTIFSDFGLYFPVNNPNLITLLQATVEVVDFDALACPGNSTPSDARAMLRGDFFNSGPRTEGSFINDVFAAISVIRRSNASANTVAVEASMWRCADASCSTFNPPSPQIIPLGTLPCPGRICPPVTLRIILDKANNQFRFFRSNVPGVPNIAEQILPYSFSDANDPGRRTKTLSVAPVPATCTATAGRKAAFMDALFDNVTINAGVTANATVGFDAIDLGELPGPGEAPVP